VRLTIKKAAKAETQVVTAQLNRVQPRPFISNLGFDYTEQKNAFGVKVVSIEPNGMLARTRVKPGETIISVNGHLVYGHLGLESLLRAFQGQPLTFEVEHEQVESYEEFVEHVQEHLDDYDVNTYMVFKPSSVGPNFYVINESFRVPSTERFGVGSAADAIIALVLLNETIKNEGAGEIDRAFMLREACGKVEDILKPAFEVAIKGDQVDAKLSARVMSTYVQARDKYFQLRGFRLRSEAEWRRERRRRGIGPSHGATSSREIDVKIPTSYKGQPITRVYAMPFVRWLNYKYFKKDELLSRDNFDSYKAGQTAKLKFGAYAFVVHPGGGLAQPSSPARLKKLPKTDVVRSNSTVLGLPQ
jgi:hypothetical protein